MWRSGRSRAVEVCGSRWGPPKAVLTPTPRAGKGFGPRTARLPDPSQDVLGTRRAVEPSRPIRLAWSEVQDQGVTVQPVDTAASRAVGPRLVRRGDGRRLSGRVGRVLLPLRRPPRVFAH